MFLCPAVVIMAISATRMHRSLVDFASRPPADVCAILHLKILLLTMANVIFSVNENFQRSGLRFMKTDQTQALQISLNPMEPYVHNVSDQPPSPRMIQHDPSINI